MRRVLMCVLLGASLASVQSKDEAYDDEMHKAEQLIARRQYEQALQSYKKAYALKDKASLDALFGMAVAYRGLAANKNVVDLLTADGLKLAGDDQRSKARVLNMRGAALVALSDKPTDKRLTDAEADFRAALEAHPDLAQARMNLGITLLKQGHDEDGRRELQAYVAKAPDGPEKSTALKMIEEPRRAREVFAPEFSLTSKNGEFITSEDLKGKTILLDFWGTWCKPCVMATPGLVRLQKKFADQPVVIISVAENDKQDAWAAYIEKNNMTWAQFFDSTRKMASLFGIHAYPTYVVIDGEGVLRFTHSGYGMDTDGLVESEIKKTLKKRATDNAEKK